MNGSWRGAGRMIVAWTTLSRDVEAVLRALSLDEQMRFDEIAAFLTYQQNEPRPYAEARAFEIVMGYKPDLRNGGYCVAPSTASVQ
jgi:hypothetical protein